MFHALVDWAYGVCDDQKTNHINFSELYAGLLLVHVKLAKFAGAAACFPPSKEAVKELFKASDVDRSGGIDREEFNIILSVSCAQIMGRILVNYAMYIFMIPFLAKHLVDYFSNLTENSYLEMVCEQLAGTLLFLVIVPLLHGRIDKTSVFQAERKANEKRLQRDGSVGSSLGISERSNFSSNLSVGDKEGSISFEADEEEDHNLNNQSEDKDSDNEKEPKLAEEEPLKSTEQKKDD